MLARSGERDIADVHPLLKRAVEVMWPWGYYQKPREVAWFGFMLKGWLPVIPAITWWYTWYVAEMSHDFTIGEVPNELWQSQQRQLELGSSIPHFLSAKSVSEIHGRSTAEGTSKFIIPSAKLAVPDPYTEVPCLGSELYGAIWKHANVLLVVCWDLLSLEILSSLSSGLYYRWDAASLSIYPFTNMFFLQGLGWVVFLQGASLSCAQLCPVLPPRFPWILWIQHKSFCPASCMRRTGLTANRSCISVCHTPKACLTKISTRFQICPCWWALCVCLFPRCMILLMFTLWWTNPPFCMGTSTAHGLVQ